MPWGTVTGGLLGLVLGVLVGHGVALAVLLAAGLGGGLLFDRVGASVPRPPSDDDLQARARARFARHLCHLFVEVARADGEVVRDEVRLVRVFFAEQLLFTDAELEGVRLALKEALARPPALAEVARDCREAASEAERRMVLGALYELALADGPLRPSERAALSQVAALLEVPPEDVRALEAQHLDEAAAHLATLGLPPEASAEDLKRAFRRLAAVHHPDKVAHLGPAAVARASRRFQEIRAAYEHARAARGL